MAEAYLARFVQIAGTVATTSLSVALLFLVMVVYRKRKETGFLLLAFVFAYGAVSAILGAFGIHISTMLPRDQMNGHWILIYTLLYIPSVVSVIGWAFLAFRKGHGPNQSPDPMGSVVTPAADAPVAPASDRGSSVALGET
jgi:hypothetical protein